MNFGLCSRFYEPDEIQDFMSILRRGDLIEFDRGSYCHWAVYVGNARVIHRNNDEERSLTNFSATFKSTKISKEGSSGFKGRVMKEVLKDVICGSRMRINNKYDEENEPLDMDEIMERLIKEMKEENPYDLLLNNCEHFAKWARNGKKKSQQVEDFIEDASNNFFICCSPA